MSIPWDDPYDDRPACLPEPGEPIEPETAARLMAHYGPAVAAELERIAGIVRERAAAVHRETRLWIHLWTVDEVIQNWSDAVDAVLLGFVTLDDQGHSRRFRDVRVSVDKQRGEVVTQDDTGLLTPI